MNKKFRSLFILVITLIVLSTTLIGCNNSTYDDTLTKVTVSEVTHSVFYAPQYVAINLGFFEEEGIDLELINSQGADKVMTAVLSKQVDIGFAGPEAAIYVYNEGKEDYTQVFAQITQKDGSFLVSREPIENFEWTDLKDKHVLPGRKGGVPYMTLQYVIEQHGLDVSKDLNFDNSISYDTMNSAFAAGTGDFVTIFEPTATVFENEGKGYIVASIGEDAGEIPYTAYFANKSFINNNPELIQKFVNAIYKGQQWVETHSAREIAEVLADSFPEVDIKVLETVVNRYKEIDAWKTEPSMTEESFNKLQEVMINANELSQSAPFEKVVNNSFATNLNK
ncbi:MAG: ABC transporter substrate-binding protein [Clostridia bacterium]|nr:ABC transporter substrate-binding protein [Clostridia bacterium]